MFADMVSGILLCVVILKLVLVIHLVCRKFWSPYKPPRIIVVNIVFGIRLREGLEESVGPCGIFRLRAGKKLRRELKVVQ